MKGLKPIPASLSILEKIENKHGIAFVEVESMFRRPHLVLRGSMDQYGERRYTSMGQTGRGRYILAVYVIEEPDLARIITARDMTDRERTYYRKAFRQGRRQP